jgi:EAL domain-containing protein (putative c-di-GMP-specific phosphodiesterase class I)
LAAPHIVRALVGLAGPLGIDVVAEGVESTHQAEELAALGCSLGQGNLLSRPLDAVRASEFLERSTHPLAVSLV